LIRGHIAAPSCLKVRHQDDGWRYPRLRNRRSAHDMNVRRRGFPRSLVVVPAAGRKTEAGIEPAKGTPRTMVQPFDLPSCQRTSQWRRAFFIHVNLVKKDWVSDRGDNRPTSTTIMRGSWRASKITPSCTSSHASRASKFRDHRADRS